MVNSLVESKLWHHIKVKRLNLKKTGASMIQPAVRDYINSIRKKYQESSKKEKSKILDVSMYATGRSRKHLIKLLSSPVVLENKRSGRPQRYDYEGLRPHILYLWKSMNYVDAKRMKSAFKDWLPHYKDIPAVFKMQLLQISSSTLSRYLKKYKAENQSLKGLSTTKGSKSSQKLKHSVAIQTLDSSVKEAGHVQMDTVSHCGSNSQGPFISTLTVTDILTGWTSNGSMMGKKGGGVIDLLREMETSELPFLIQSANGDCGSEFLNKTVIGYAKKRWKLTRSRPYKKNDNCFVEQKNFTHVRELFGYERLDEDHLVELMNDIYRNYWNPLQNFFLPSVKLKEKVRIGSRIKKIYDEPKTPYQRILAAPNVDQNYKDQLIEIKSKLNPFRLKQKLDFKIKEFNQILRSQEKQGKAS